MAYSLSPLLKPRFFVNATNKPLVGGKLYTYLAETTTPATTYSNDTGTPNTNPIILDANGECNLYLDDDKVYRLILKDANDVTYFDKDRVSSIGGGDYKVLTFDTIADLRLKIGSAKEPVAQTSGYYAAGDGGGNSFYWDGTSGTTDNGGTVIKPTFVSGAGRWIALNRTSVNVLQFGAYGNDSVDDTTAVQAALTACKNVVIPSSKTCKITQVTISQADSVLRIDGVLKSTVATNKAIIVDAANVSIIGTGSIDAPATFDGTNTGAKPTYAVIWVQENGFRMSGLTFNNTPKVGVFFDDCCNFIINDCICYGNFPLASYDDTLTMHFFVSVNPPSASTSSDFAIISNCYFEQYITSVYYGNYGGAANNLSIQVSGNRFSKCLDHGIYLRLSKGAVVSDNNFYNCASPIVCDAEGSLINGNTLFEDNTFANRRTQIINLRSSSYGVVSNNTIIGKGASINIDYIQDSSTILGNKIHGNTVIQTEADNVRTPFCIRITSSAGLVSNNTITNNTVRTRGFSALNGAILINGNGTYSATDNIISGNHITVTGTTGTGALNGITEVLCTHNIIDDNMIIFDYEASSAVTLSGIYIVGSKTSARRNTIKYEINGSNVAFRGIQIASGNYGTFIDNLFYATSASLVSATNYFNSSSTTAYVLDKRHIERTAAPVSGDWVRGDIVYNSAPTAGGFLGWCCVTSGTPGTWKTFGAITA